MKRPQPSDADSPMTANPGYALGQLAHALTSSETNEDAEVRARASQKVKTWTQVFQGMISGVLRIGSRTPVKDTPVWATLEVVQGGFATGTLLAGGELQPHEVQLLGRLPGSSPGAERAVLNGYYISDEGLAELQLMLSSGCYRVDLPEEGALLVVAWLAQQGHPGQARELLDEIGPYFSRLRFYPIPESQPMIRSATVHLQDVRTSIRQLQAVQPKPLLEKEREAVEVWSPLYDRVFTLFLETVDGAPPSVKRRSDGMPLRNGSGKFQVEGGWPCQQYPDGWNTRARAVLGDYHRLRSEHRLCMAPDAESGGFPTLRRYLAQCVKDPQRLSGRDVGRIRSILAGTAAKRGLPGSDRWRLFHELQAQEIAGPTRTDLAKVLIDRLSGLSEAPRIDSLYVLLAPVSELESDRFGVPVGTGFPESLADRVRRCVDAPVASLLERCIIKSGEVLARIVPQMTAQTRAADIPDPDLRRLCEAIYRAFRRRRSVLLLNLESQVRLNELPWLKVIDTYRTESAVAREEAHQALKELARLTLKTFPHQILPNKLLQELRTLVDAAGLQIPIVDEVAADIFMGQFSEKFLRAAQTAADLLEGTLYERYYGLPYKLVRGFTDLKSTPSGAHTSPEFDRLCRALAGETGTPDRWSVAHNGKIIEQEQILTTHNLAALFDSLALAEALGPELEELAFGCFAWICRRLRLDIRSHKAKLRNVKNSAYAWRQMIFFLTLAPDAVDSFLVRAAARLRDQPSVFQARFQPALTGLIRAAAGLPVETEVDSQNPARRFTGWTTGPHWLLDPALQKHADPSPDA